MKKFSVSLFGAVAVAFFSVSLAAQTPAPSPDSVGGANPRPQSVGGANPRPQSVGGANPRPQDAPVEWTQIVLNLLNLI